jgi:hypothetical protein
VFGWLMVFYFFNILGELGLIFLGFI